MWWYEIHKDTISVITKVLAIIFAINPSWIENTSKFSLAGFIGKSNRASFIMTNLSILVCMNKNKRFGGYFEIIIFYNKFDDLEDELDEVKQYIKDQ